MTNILASWEQRWAERRALKQAEQREKAQSDEIERQLQEECRASWKKADILLIGPEAESFTFVTLMKFMQDHYTNAEFRPVIWKNLLRNSRDVVLALHKLNLDHVNRSTEANCEYIMKHRDDTDNPDFLFLPRFAEVIQDLWTEEVLPLLLDEPSAISFDDNAAYFFAEAQRIAAEDYVPSIEDIGHISEFPEKGITETHFNYGELALRVLRVNYGQQDWFSIRKWIPLFQDVMNVMFIVSLADYDEPGISGVGQQTRLAEHLALFDAVVNSPWFRRTSVLLYFTGMAEFRTKLQEVPLNEYFPEYAGGTDVDEGARYIQNRFADLNHGSSARMIHVFTSEVSDVAAFRHFVIAVSDSMMRNHLRIASLI